MLKSLIAVALFVAVPSIGLAQDQAGNGTANSGLPAICTVNAPADGAMSMGSHDMGGSDAQKDLMDGMDQMNADMMAGGTATDIDVAFVCSMIPHHRGAIDMAKAELAHGDDPWARKLAESVIAAQEQEIADMLKWLEGQE